MLHPLLRYEWAVVRNEFALALPGWRDRLMLAAMAALAIVLFIESDVSAALHDRWVAATLGVAAGWAGVRAGRRRLDHLAHESVIAAAALDPAGRGRYWAVLLLGLAGILTAIGGRAGPVPILFMLAGMAAGVSVAALLRARLLPARPSDMRPRRAVHAITPFGAVTGYQLGADSRASRIAIPLAAALATVAVAAALPHAWNPALRLALPAGISALAMVALTRVDAECVIFLARAGHGAWRSAGLHLRAAAAYAALAVPLLLLFAPGALWPCIAAIAAIGIVAVLRVWSFRAYSRRVADLMLLFGGAGAALLAASFPPLLIPFAALAGIGLLRRAAHATWRMA